MRINKTVEGDVTILTLSGNMMNDPDVFKLHTCVKDMIENGQKKVVADLGKIKWFASTGLGALLASYTSLKNAGGDLRVARATRKIYSVFMYTQVIKILRNFDTVKEAVESYQTD